jgi:polyhydroxyalkanoate synthesis regulator phasin
MTQQIRINVTSKVNPKSIRKDVRNGRQVLIVPSATMPADIVMNEVMYPKAVIEASYASLDRAPAPCGHPKLNGSYLSARDPEAINHFHVGAWNENVQWDGSRVLLDKVIDVEFAKQTEQGQRLLNAIEKGEPISTSTGLLAEVDAHQGDGYKQIAKSVIFDHDAILLDEEPAASPEQGVGMLVNGKTIPVMNYELDSAFREIDWAGQEMVRSIQRAADATLWAKIRDKVMAVIKEAVGIPADDSATATANSEETDMSAEDLKALNEKFGKLETKLNEMDEAVKAAAPAATLETISKGLADLTAAVAALTSAKNAEDEAAKEADVKEVVDAGLMNEEEAKKADAVVVNALAKKARELKSANPTAAPILRANALQKPEPTKVADHFV